MTPGSKPTPTGIITFLVVSNTLGVYASLAFLLFFPVPTENRELVSMMIGNIIGFLAGIMAYHFSSNRDSEGKTQAIQSQTQAIATLADTAKRAGENLSPTPDVVIPAGETATIQAGDDHAQHP